MSLCIAGRKLGIVRGSFHTRAVASGVYNLADAAQRARYEPVAFVASREGERKGGYG